MCVCVCVCFVVVNVLLLLLLLLLLLFADCHQCAVGVDFVQRCELVNVYGKSPVY